MTDFGKILTVFVFLATMALADSADAQACAGVEARVNNRTQELTTSVTTLITERTAAIVAQETMQRAQLLSALRTLTRQESLAAQQEVNADRAAMGALANVIVEESVARQTHDAISNYGHTGHAACELVAAGQTIASMLDNYSSARSGMAEAVRQGRTATTDAEFRERMAEWSNLVRTADDATVHALLAGDENAARAFIALVSGPPRYRVEGGSGSVLSGTDRVLSLRDDARNAAAGFALADLAANQALRDAMDAKSDIWIGNGGEEWTARMAAAPTRGVLLDTARIEAHNIATLALELKQQTMAEFALAVFALSHVDWLRDAQVGRMD